MQTLRTILSLRATVQEWRRRGGRIAFVPTMGNLHEGHLQLVKEAQRLGDHVVVSIFVNPLQFGKNEDYGAYPRTLERDSALLAEHGVQALFMPEAREIYPHGLEQETRVVVPGLSDILCGASRPGHFAGVATVVAKLFNIVGPDVAVFGEKDFQQLMIIRRMAQDLCFPLNIIGVPIVRESDGLAMSSRNQYLTVEERRIAPALYQTLCGIKEDMLAGGRDYGCLEKEAVRGLESAGFRPDYFSVRHIQDLAEPTAADVSLVILVAAWLGRTRLIDNVSITLAP